MNQDDLAPHLPPEFAGFLHGGREVWVKNGKGDTVDCGQVSTSVSLVSSDAESHPELENPACSHSIKIGWDISKHGFLWDAWVGHHSCFSLNGTIGGPLDLVNE